MQAPRPAPRAPSPWNRARTQAGGCRPVSPWGGGSRPSTRGRIQTRPTAPDDYLSIAFLNPAPSEQLRQAGPGTR